MSDIPLPTQGDFPVVGTGMPASMYLDLFGKVVLDAFDEVPYLVGSAFRGKQWRDVDVRLMLDEQAYERFIGDGEANSQNPRWRALCMAFSELGRRITGLPIDFQIQRRTEANEHFKGFRQPLIWAYPPSKDEANNE